MLILIDTCHLQRLVYGITQNNCGDLFFIRKHCICKESQERHGSAVVSTSACHDGGLGSLPGPGATTINVLRACLGAQLTICAQK